ncbi:MAG: phosphoglycerate kinase, partial [Clostridia bacterium]|nr:phosphoglycerate kinase [Clostridia bacterium]
MSLTKKSIKDIDVFEKAVIMRADFNVPMDENGNIADKTRITTTLPTIKYLINNRAKTILMSHLGDPKNGYEESKSLKPICECLCQLLNKDVKFAKDAIGEGTEKMVAEMKEGDVLLLENLRFHKEEKENDAEFAKKLASYGEIYVNDAFGTSHRKHASTYGIGKYLPSVSGFLIEKEIEMLGKALDNPEREFTAILGGAKVTSKIGVINHLFDRADNILIGGGMAFTFIKAMGHNIGNSILDEEHIEYAKEVMAKAKNEGVNLVLPVDVVIADDFSNDAKTDIVDINAIPDGVMGLDIGPKTREIFKNIILQSKTVVWNGPMGAFEMSKFAKGTQDVAFAMAQTDGTTIVGGGDSARAIDTFGLQSSMTDISTGGGASLAFMEGKSLPGIEILTDKRVRKTIFAGNWKMNLNINDGLELINRLTKVSTEAEMIVCPPFTMLDALSKEAMGSRVSIGAQNMHFEEKGAYTGEVSANMLLEVGAKYVIIGHSERREYFAETDQTVNKKVVCAISKGLMPIICVG